MVGSPVRKASQWTAKKGPAVRGHVKKRQNSSKSVKNIFDILDIFRAGQKASKIVKKCQTYFRHFSTILARHQLPALFKGALSIAAGPLIESAIPRRLPSWAHTNGRVTTHPSKNES